MLPAWIGAALLASGMLSALPTPARWALPSGLGGNWGDVLHGFVMVILSPVLRGFPADVVVLVLLGGSTLWAIYNALYAKPAVPRGSKGKRKTIVPAKPR